MGKSVLRPLPRLSSRVAGKCAKKSEPYFGSSRQSPIEGAALRWEGRAVPALRSELVLEALLTSRDVKWVSGSTRATLLGKTVKRFEAPPRFSGSKVQTLFR